DQGFPFYTYDEDGTNRRENITDWALAQFRAHYGDASIEKWDIFHYAYGLLHHPDYRERYGANLKRDLPHLPFAPSFWEFANAGKALAELHVNYEKQPVYPLRRVETPGMQLNWRVEKARLSDDKTCIHYNDFLTLEGIPMEAFAYQLGTYSALEWVLERYQVTEDDASGIVNDANRADAPSYIVDLIGRVLTVSLETVRIVGELPGL
ncbi:DNA helicase, partial [Candidatus Poribacteria bacterium]